MQQGDALLQAVFVDIDAGNGQCVVRNICRIDLHIGPCQSCQHCQAAVASAQIQHAAGAGWQKRINAAVGQDFGNQAARDDGACIYIKRHALQPRFAREVGGGFAAADALLYQGGYGLLLGSGGRGQGGVVNVAIKRQAQLPQDQPGGFIKGVGGAVAVAYIGLLQALGLERDEGA